MRGVFLKYGQAVTCGIVFQSNPKTIRRTIAMQNNQVTTHQHYSPRAILVAIGSSRRMFLLAPLIEFLFADLADVVFVAELFENIATRFVVIAFAETKVWFFLS